MTLDEFQAQSRLFRSGIVLPGKYASRNEREGVYAFKIKGRHIRQRRRPKIVILSLGPKLTEFIARATKLKKEVA